MACSCQACGREDSKHCTSCKSHTEDNPPSRPSTGLLARVGGQKHPNNLPPLSKRRSVMQWDTLGLERMVESEEVRVTSDVDSGGGDSSCDSMEAGYSTDSEGQYSMDISDTRLMGWVGESGSEGFGRRQTKQARGR